MSDAIIGLITFAFAATASPGGATSLVTASGAQFGYLRSLPLVFGIAGTLAVLVAVSCTGLSGFILAFPILEVTMKVLGSAYLFWLAIMILRSASPQNARATHSKPLGFIGGSMLLLINPKAWAMAFSVAGSFSGISDNLLSATLMLGSVFVLSASISLSLWAAMGTFIAKRLNKEWHWTLFNLIMSVLLILSIISFWR